MADKKPAKKTTKAIERTKQARQVVRTRASGSVMGFTDFIRTQGVVGLAIGFVMGTQAKVLIDQFTRSFVEPVLTLIFGGSKPFSAQSVYLQINSRSATFKWGEFVYTVINFLIVAAVIYLAFKALRLDKLEKKKD